MEPYQKNIHNMLKYQVHSNGIIVYSIFVANSNERKFFNFFSNLLDKDLSNRIDHFVLNDNLEDFLSYRQQLTYQIVSEYFDLKFSCIVFNIDKKISNNQNLTNQLIKTKENQLKKFLNNDVVYYLFEKNKIENLNCKMILDLNSKLGNENPQYYCLKSSIEVVCRKQNWLNKIDLDFKIDFEIDLNECVLFCECTKNTKISKQKIEKKNWNFLSDKEDQGYYAISFYKHALDKTIVVISHRGTRFNKLNNILYDLEIALQIEPYVVKNALKYENQVLEEFDSSKNSVILIHIGFSLGGYLAANCACRDFKRKYVTKYAVTFEAPGVLFKPSNQVKNYENIVNYFIVPNLVNTCNFHIGKIYQFSVDLTLSCENVKICPKKWKSLFRELKLLSKTHNLELIFGLTSCYNNLKRVKEWPIARNKISIQKLIHKRSNKVIYY